MNWLRSFKNIAKCQPMQHVDILWHTVLLRKLDIKLLTRRALSSRSPSVTRVVFSGKKTSEVWNFRSWIIEILNISNTKPSIWYWLWFVDILWHNFSARNFDLNVVFLKSCRETSTSVTRALLFSKLDLMFSPEPPMKLESEPWLNISHNLDFP